MKCIGQTNRIGGVIVSMLDSSAVYRGFKPRPDQTKDYEIDICWFPADSAKHAAPSSTSKDWLARNQNSVFEWSDMSIRGLLFQRARTIKIQLSMLVEYIIISPSSL